MPDTNPVDSIFDPAAYERLVRRLDALRPDARRQWGRMTVSQMCEHTARAAEMASGRMQMNQALLGKLIGWLFRGAFLGPKPFAKGSPTAPDFVVREDPDFAQAKARLRSVLDDLHAIGEEAYEITPGDGGPFRPGAPSRRAASRRRPAISTRERTGSSRRGCC